MFGGRGFERVALPQDYFDLAISNIPFSEIGVVDPSMIVTAQFPLAAALDALEAAQDTARNVKVHIQTG